MHLFLLSFLYDRPDVMTSGCYIEKNVDCFSAENSLNGKALLFMSTLQFCLNLDTFSLNWKRDFQYIPNAVFIDS